MSDCSTCRDKKIVPAPAFTPPFMPCPTCCPGMILVSNRGKK